MSKFDRRFLTENEAATYLNVSRRTLQQWRWRGLPPRFAKFSRSVRYDVDDLEAFIQQSGRNSTSHSGDSSSRDRAASDQDRSNNPALSGGRSPRRKIRLRNRQPGDLQ